MDVFCTASERLVSTLGALDSEVDTGDCQALTNFDFNVTGFNPHPFIDELMLIFGEHGVIMLVDIITRRVAWSTREDGLFRKIPLRAISVDACSFTPDGNKIIAISVLGTISLFCADGLINGV